MLIEDKIEKLEKWVGELSADNRRLRAALDEALAVVRPFGDRAVAWKHNADSARVSVRLADLRAARRFYEKHKGGAKALRRAALDVKEAG